MIALEEALAAIINATSRLLDQMTSLAATVKAVEERVKKTDGKELITSACVLGTDRKKSHSDLDRVA